MQYIRGSTYMLRVKVGRGDISICDLLQLITTFDLLLLITICDSTLLVGGNLPHTLCYDQDFAIHRRQ